MKKILFILLLGVSVYSFNLTYKLVGDNYTIDPIELHNELNSIGISINGVEIDGEIKITTSSALTDTDFIKIQDTADSLQAIKDGE